MSHLRIRAGALALLLGLLALPASAQETGRLIGRVVDASNAKPLVGAQVYVNDGVVGTLSDLNGRYVLVNVPVGVVDVTVQQLGYGTKTVTGVRVLAGQISSLDITMEETAVEIEGITVSAEREEGSTAFLLNQRRTAPALVEAVGSDEISRRPDSDAADVAQRMTGVTVTEGKYVFVRGLGERYSQTSLNGSSLPSPEPEREVVPLDLFPSGFLESLVTQKSYTPDLPADFSGGSVQIQTKDFPSRFSFRVGVGTSFNTESSFKDDFLYYDGGGTDFLGLDDGARAQPSAVTQVMGTVMSGERLPSDPSQLVQIGEAFRGVGQTFAPLTGTTPLNRSLDLSVGGRKDVLGDGELGFFLAGTYSDDYTIRDNEIERKWRTSAFDESTAGFATPNVDYTFNRGTRAISWGTIGNVAFKPNPNQKIALKTTVNLSTDSEARIYEGANEEDIGAYIRSERGRWVERLMLWSQLSGEHLTLWDSRLEWRLTAARANRDEPLMRETIYDQDPVSGNFFLLDFTESARYFYSELTDDDLSAEVDWRVPFEFFGNEAAVKVGAAFRDRTRDFGARRLNWRFAGGTVEDLDAALESGTVVAQRNPGVGEFSMSEVVEPGDLYDADDRRIAGYVMMGLPLGSRLDAVLGARVEDYTLGLHSRGEALQENAATDVTPSLNLTYSVSDAIKLRGSVSQTLDRPEFRELAPFQFTEATSLRQLFGNPELESATIRSADLRLDWFPSPGEMISVGGFYKDMDEPIEQVFVAAASSAYSFQNADEAQVLGLELDVQLGLDRIWAPLQPFSFQGNYSWIDSEVKVRSEGIFQPTSESRPLEGQAPYVLNVGLNYASRFGLEAGLFLNRFGPRITAAGGSGVPDIEEQPRNALDATLAFPLPRGVRAKIKASNLLDADYLFNQSLNGFTRVQRQYSVGRTISVGLSWEF
jgi:hypothetical protein